MMPSLLRNYVRSCLLEGKYAQMNKGLSSDGQESFNKAVSWARSTLKKEDRIIWFLRIFKASLLKNEILSKGKNENSLKTYQKLQGMFLKNGFDVEDYFDHPVGIMELMLGLRNNLRHYMGIKSQKIQNFKFDWQSPNTIFQTFQKWDDEWKEFSKGSISYNEDDQHTEVLPFPDGKVWLNLNKTSCDLEAAAMGHCGNEGGNEDETILSLRTKDDKNQRWIVHLTFTFNKKTGRLIEMKGRGNDKPSEKYHKYIIQLLKMDFIKGITGGGYLPENNFDIHDLGDDAKALLAVKPALESLKDRMKRGSSVGNIDEDTLQEFGSVYGQEIIDDVSANDWHVAQGAFYIDFDNKDGDFYQEHAGDFGNWAISILTGDEHLDISDTGVPISDIYEYLDVHLQDEMKLIYRESNGLVPEEEIEEDDFLDHFEQFLSTVGFRAVENSYMSQLHDIVQAWVEEIGGDTLEDSIVTYEVPIDHIKDIAEEEGVSSYVRIVEIEEIRDPGDLGYYDTRDIQRIANEVKDDDGLE